MDDLVKDLRTKLVVPEELFDAVLRDIDISWHQLARGESPLTFEQVQSCVINNNRDIWSGAFLKEPDTGLPYTFWDYQIPSIRYNGNSVHQDGAEVGKTREIIVRLMHCALTRPNTDSMVGAPEQVHLDDIIDGIEWQLDNNPALGVYLKKHKKHPHHVLYWTNGARTFFCPAGFDGSGFRGKHCAGEVIMEEAAKIKNPTIWIEFWRSGKPGCRFGIYSVSDGDRTSTYYRLTRLATGEGRPNDGASMPADLDFRLFRWNKTMQPPPFWTHQRKKFYIDTYGGEDSPGYQRNVLGLHGDPENVVFPYSQFIRCMRDISAHRTVKILMDDATVSATVARFELSADKSTGKSAPREILLEDSATPRADFEIAAFLKRSLVSVPGVLVLGADLGFAKDPTEIIIRLIFGAVWRTVARIQLKGVTYDQQCAAIDALDDIYHLHRLGIDKGSAGTAVIHNLLSVAYLEKKYDERMVQVDFGASMERIGDDGDIVIDQKTEKPARQNTKELSTDLLVQKMQRGTWELPGDPDYYTIFPSQTWRQGTKMRIFSKGNDHLPDAERAASAALAAAVDVEEDYFETGANQR